MDKTSTCTLKATDLFLDQPWARGLSRGDSEYIADALLNLED
jgi:hypothetical protein